MISRRVISGMVASALAVGLSMPVSTCIAEVTSSPDTDVASLREVARLLGFDRDDVATLRRGRPAAHSPDAQSDRELTAIVAVLLEATPGAVSAVATGDRLLEIGRDIDFSQRVMATESLSAKLGFESDDEAPLRLLARPKPGSDINLSAQEIERLCTDLRGLAGRERLDRDARGRINRAYLDLLGARLRAYSEAGTSATAAYDRGSGKTTNPGGELQMAAAAVPWLETLDPELFEALRASSPGPGETQSFVASRETIEGQSTLVLAHRMERLGADRMMAVERQFYVGRSYNALQTIAGWMVVREGTLVFYASRTSSDQAAGFGTGLRHTIGRRILRGTVTEGLESIVGEIAD